MTHDQTESLCQFVTKAEYYYQANNGFYPPPDCQCELIAKVRHDERQKLKEHINLPKEPA